MNAMLHREVMREIAEAMRAPRHHETWGIEFRAAQAASMPGASGRWFATPHAVARWREHYDRRARTYEEALGSLIHECNGARFLKALDTGPQLWRGPRPRRARFIVSVCSEGALAALVTVLPPFDGYAAR